MNGEVDGLGRALLTLHLRSSGSAQPTTLMAWIDTAFTGELVVPRTLLASLGLPRSAAVLAGLADGTEVVLDCYTCEIEWFGETRTIEAIENDGQFPLLGIGLLNDRRIEINYRSRTVVMD